MSQLILVLKLTMRTADSVNSGRGGHNPKLVVKTCDGTVKFTDLSYAYRGSNGVKSWTVPNFDAVSDVIEFEASTTNAWLVDHMEMQICDKSGNDCLNQPVLENYSGDKVAGNAFWIDGVCSSPNNHVVDVCHDAYKCNCYQKKFYINRLGDEWVMDDNVSICDIKQECSAPETYDELGTTLKARIQALTAVDMPPEKQAKAAKMLSNIVDKTHR